MTTIVIKEWNLATKQGREIARYRETWARPHGASRRFGKRQKVKRAK